MLPVRSRRLWYGGRRRARCAAAARPGRSRGNAPACPSPTRAPNIPGPSWGARQLRAEGGNVGLVPVLQLTRAEAGTRRSTASCTCRCPGSATRAGAGPPGFPTTWPSQPNPRSRGRRLTDAGCGRARRAGSPVTRYTGADPGLCVEMDQRRIGYVLAVARANHVATPAGALRADAIAARLPARPGSGHPRSATRPVSPSA